MTNPGPLALLLHNAPLWIEHFSNDTNQSERVRNIVGPWINCMEERNRLKETLMSYYTRDEDLGMDEEWINDMFHELLTNRYTNMFGANSTREVFRFTAETVVKPEITARVKAAAVQEGPTYFWTARLLEGHNELIADATEEAIVEEYVVPEKRYFSIGNDLETFNSKDEALAHASRMLSLEKFTDNIKDMFRNTHNNVCWKMGTSDQTLKWLVTVTRVSVSSIGDRKQA